MPEEPVCILLPDGKVRKGNKVPDIGSEDLLRIYRVMLLNRRLDERMIKLQRQGRIGFYVGSVGEEASIIGATFALEETDWIFPCYREVGSLLLRGFPLFELCCQLFGNSQDSLQGRQMPNHYASSKLRFGSISSTVGSQIPHATGVGLASKLQGREDVALTFFGDGATSTGDFHAAVNFAGVYKAQTIFMCRNNQWAISVPSKAQTASESMAVKAKAYGIDGVQVDGNDVFAVYEVTKMAAEKARQGNGPTLIEAITYRLGGHTTSDDPRLYRDDVEVERWEKKDPLLRFRSYLLDTGHLNGEADTTLEREIKEELKSALDKAEKIDPPTIDTMFEDVLDDTSWHLEEQRKELGRVLKAGNSQQKT